MQSNKVDVLYLTDRAPQKPSPGKPYYGAKRSRSVAFGVSEVEFGKDVSWDQLVAASRTSKRTIDLPVKVVRTTELVRFPETPRILMTLPPHQPAATQPTTGATAMRAQVDVDMQRCYAELSARLAKTPDKEVYIFVHGYANSFDDSVTTLAQVWHFLGRRGVPVAYSWPAGGGGLLRGYTYDRESSEFTVYHLKQMIRAIAECPDVQKIHILCHSRGTGVVVNALAELHLEISGSGRSTRDVLKLQTVVLAAPDIDFDVMIQRAVTVRLGLVPEQSVVYVCANDQALGIANWLFGGLTRLGAVRSDMFSPDEMQILRDSKTVQFIDARVSGTGFISHDYFHSNPAVSSDLILVLRYKRKPGAENGRPLQTEPDSAIWMIKDGYPGATTIPADTPTTMPAATTMPAFE
jgi:esterase/lipase superfamily enzyme